VFFLEDKIDQPCARAGDNKFIIRLSEKSTDCQWFNSDHFIFLAGQTLKTAEIDTRDRVNVFDLAKYPILIPLPSIPKTSIFLEFQQ